ncbi:hypothetical protein Q31b_51330 [Novipirellula aureliae]|uniref:EF-hand domain-containing protein n=1 Tax=Novipirellula aureliae TaxID=2527966 RepID=A0A5C6DG48_9BACT|nr:EF-hand domain-containing protein [Novipirellula aureliae]TWU35698.1 hypothetical protein Q31b_51330 [Novipirellula aureliae]
MNRVFQFSIFASIALSTSLLFAQPPGRGGASGMGRGGPPLEMIIQLFTQADSDHNGSVTKAELMAVLQNQGQGNQLGRGGPPLQNNNFGQANQQAANQPRPEGAPEGPPPTPGQVLPERLTQSLNLSVRQERQLAALQADVDKRLAAILTDEQEEQLQNFQPSHGPDHAEGGDADVENGRPQRPE